MAERRTIPVRILGQEYRVRSESGDELVRRAAALVDDTMGRVRERTRTVDSQDVAVLAALNLANQLLVARAKTADDLGDRIAPLLSLVEEALAEEQPAGA